VGRVGAGVSRAVRLWELSAVVVDEVFDGHVGGEDHADDGEREF
jgi:hypothetical protein